MLAYFSTVGLQCFNANNVFGGISLKLIEFMQNPIHKHQHIGLHFISYKNDCLRILYLYKLLLNPAKITKLYFNDGQICQRCHHCHDYDDESI